LRQPLDLRQPLELHPAQAAPVVRAQPQPTAAAAPAPVPQAPPVRPPEPRGQLVPKPAPAVSPAPPIVVAPPVPVAVEPIGARSQGQILAAIRSAIDENRIDIYLQPLVTLPQRKVRFYEAATRPRDGR